MKNASIVIHDQEVLAGEYKTIMLPVPKFYDWTPLAMPVHILNGKEPGPILCVTAAIHGDELNGVEIIRRLNKRMCKKRIRGTLIMVPIVNVYGFLNQDRYLMDRRDLNRAFPGSKQGSLAARLAHLVIKELASKATHLIDLHSGSLHRTNLPQIRVNLDNNVLKQLACAFNAPVILHSSCKEGSFREYAENNNKPALLFEAGESLRFDEISIRTGIRGILNVMDYLGMLKVPVKHNKMVIPALAKASYWVRATYSGTLRPFKKLGEQVKKDELLAVIANPNSTEEHSLMSPIGGIIIGKSEFPLVHEGAALFHIACFDVPKHAMAQIDLLQERFHDYENKHSDDELL